MKSATSAAEHGRRQTVGGLPPVPPRRDSPGRRDSTPMRLPRVRIRRRKLERIIDPIVAVDLAAIVAIKGRLAIGAITRRLFENLLVEINDIAALFGVVSQDVPGQRIIIAAKTE